MPPPVKNSNSTPKVTLTLIISISSVLIAIMMAVTIVMCVIMKRRRLEKVVDLTQDSNVVNLPKVRERMPHSKVFRATLEEEQLAQAVHGTPVVTATATLMDEQQSRSNSRNAAALMTTSS